jgi:large subunit ribosomal protein L29
MKMEELRELSVDELKAKVAQFTRDKFNHRFRSATEDITHKTAVRLLRRDIARIHTILRERELAEGAES